MAYLVRRLLENTSNESFLKASFTARARVDDLLRDPEEVGAMWGRNPRPKPAPPAPSALPPFRNEPLTDFTRPEARAAVRVALEEVRAQLGRSYPLAIGGREVTTPEQFPSLDPGDSRTVVGRFARAGAEHAAKAVAAAAARLRGRGRPPLPRSAPRSSSAPPRSCGSDASRWPPGRSSSAASPGARPTPTSPRRSTSASSTPAR